VRPPPPPPPCHLACTTPGTPSRPRAALPGMPSALRCTAWRPPPASWSCRPASGPVSLPLPGPVPAWCWPALTAPAALVGVRSRRLWMLTRPPRRLPGRPPWRPPRSPAPAGG
jgi:hypothetical protein